MREQIEEQTSVDGVTAPDEDEDRSQPPEVSDWSSLADDELYRAELLRRLCSALTALPSRYRSPVCLCDGLGLSTDEASAVLKVDP